MYILTKEQLEERDRKQRELCRIAVKPYLPFDSTGAATGEGQQAVLNAPSPELPVSEIDWEGLEEEFYKWENHKDPTTAFNFFKTNLPNYLKK